MSVRSDKWLQTSAVVLVALLTVGNWGCGDDDDNGGAASTTMAVRRTDLVSDVSGQAPVTDTNLANAWGLARSATGPFWVADNHTGLSTVYNGSGQPFPLGAPLIVTVPPPAGSPAETAAAPTGLIFNGTTDFVVSKGAASGPSTFIFATEDGTMSGWNNTVDPATAILAADNSSAEAIYKGLALAADGTANRLYATDFHNARIDVFDAQFHPIALAGSFSDPNLPSGFAPFGIFAVNGKLYVTYAKQDEDAEDDVAGAGNGFIDIFNSNGTLDHRFASQGTLNSPWGVVLAPAGFGSLGNKLLVGNFGDGRINVFDPGTGVFRGQLSNGQTPIAIDGLWALEFGNGANAGSATTLFFTAGPADEEHGLFGKIETM